MMENITRGCYFEVEIIVPFVTSSVQDWLVWNDGKLTWVFKIWVK